MTESLQETLKRGFSDFKRNMMPLTIPPLLMMVVIFILSIIFGAILGYFMYMDIASVGSGTVTYNYWAFLILTIVFVLVILLISGYFTAAIVGLSKEAVTIGTTKWKNMWGYGKKYFVRITLATIISTILSLLAIIFYLPLIYELYKAGTDPTVVFGTPVAMMQLLDDMTIYYYAGMILSTIYYILLSFVIYFVSYAIVVDDMKTIAGFKKSYQMLKENTIQVMWFVLAVTIISMLVVMVIMFLFYVFAWLLGIAGLYIAEILAFIIIIFLVALTSVWGARAYFVLEKRPVFVDEDSQKKTAEQTQ
ncbi:hypothetical protein [Methanolapillus millepedarum]|uniref:DUF7847 domain-containing protein n=1 Tax=Methanolapillus millepedarum TaxID=3028296 RepID=A0AA96V4G8_9EURY|nr:hypothetical protein MsAc7_03550 [Methanosarcinaceae archaeon Ac7]